MERNRTIDGRDMSTQPEIAKAFELVAGAFRQKPELGIGTQTSVTKVVDGLLCEIREGDWTLSVDMPEAAGGSQQLVRQVEITTLA